MAYRLYSKLPGQKYFKATCPRTLKQEKLVANIRAIPDYQSAVEAMEQAKRMCVSDQIKWEIRSDSEIGGKKR